MYYALSDVITGRRYFLCYNHVSIVGCLQIGQRVNQSLNRYHLFAASSFCAMCHVLTDFSGQLQCLLSYDHVFVSVGAKFAQHNYHCLITVQVSL